MTTAIAVSTTAHADYRQQRYSLPAGYEHFAPGYNLDQVDKDRLDDLVMRAAADLPKTHPRLYGSPQAFAQHIKTFDDADPSCDWTGETNAYAAIQNTKALWDRYTFGRDICPDTGAFALSDTPDAGYYLNLVDGKPDGNWNLRRALRVMHLIRRIDGCFQTAPEECAYDAAEFETLQKNFARIEYDNYLNLERNDFGNPKSWHHGGSGAYFDLGAINGFKIYSLFLDYFTLDRGYENANGGFAPFLLQAQYNEIAAELDRYIDMYLTQADDTNPDNDLLWTVENGNNWTYILNNAAMHWALAFYYNRDGSPNPKAEQVLRTALKYNWNHRDIYLDSGEYKEGPGYFATDFVAVNSMNILSMRTLGQPLHSMKWAILDDTSKWYVNSMATDGHALSFGDVWQRRGYTNTYPLISMMWREATGIDAYGSTTLTPEQACRARDYFHHKYYTHGYQDIWTVDYSLARNWDKIITDACTRPVAASSYTLYPEYGEAIFKSDTGRHTSVSSGSNEKDRANVTRQSMLAMTGVYNAHPHREIDFGSLIWTAHGSRLVQDFDYGQFTKGYSFYSVESGKAFFEKKSGSDYLELNVRFGEEEMLPNILQATVEIVVAGQRKRVSLKPYLPENLSLHTWYKVQINLNDFGITPGLWDREVFGTKGVQEFAVFFKSNLALPIAQLDIDEVKFVSGSSEVLWYGEGYKGSVQNGTPLFVEDDFTVGDVTAGAGDSGADGTPTFFRITSGWKRKGRIAFMYRYDVDDFKVDNNIDTFPLGASTLIIPDAKLPEPTNIDPDVAATDFTQVRGAQGEFASFTLNGLSGVRFDGSSVYGKDHEDGWMKKFHRYMLALPGGDYLIVDDFETKDEPDPDPETGEPGKKTSHIQEFFYSKADNITTCERGNGGANLSHHVDVAPSTASPGAIDFTPRCMIVNLQSPAEAAGRLSAASMRYADLTKLKVGVPDFLGKDDFFKRFVNGNTIELTNRRNFKEYRTLTTFAPSKAVSKDVRAFLFQANTSKDALVPQSVSVEECGGASAGFCVTISFERTLGNFETTRYDFNAISLNQN